MYFNPSFLTNHLYLPFLQLFFLLANPSQIYCMLFSCRLPGSEFFILGQIEKFQKQRNPGDRDLFFGIRNFFGIPGIPDLFPRVIIIPRIRDVSRFSDFNSLALGKYLYFFYCIRYQFMKPSKREKCSPVILIVTFLQLLILCSG